MKTRKLMIYNRSSRQKNVEFGGSVNRKLILGPQSFGWIPRPKTNTPVTVSDCSVHTPIKFNFTLAAESIFITDTSAGTNLIIKEGQLINRTNLPVVFVEIDEFKIPQKKCFVLPFESSDVLLSEGSMWLVVDPARGDLILSRTKIRAGDSLLECIVGDMTLPEYPKGVPLLLSK